MNTIMIRIADDHLATIKAEAEQAYPHECCGLLVGTTLSNGSVTITDVMPSPNVASTSTKDRFEIDPKVRFDVMRSVADGPKDIVGHYHSHPDHVAKPSETDVDMAFEPHFIWLIASVNKGEAEFPTAWCLNRDTREIQSVTIQSVPIAT